MPGECAQRQPHHKQCGTPQQHLARAARITQRSGDDGGGKLHGDRRSGRDGEPRIGSQIGHNIRHDRHSCQRFKCCQGDQDDGTSQQNFLIATPPRDGVTLGDLSRRFAVGLHEP